MVAALREQGGEADFIATDLRTTSGVARLAKQIGEIDLLVNNAGIYPFAPTHEVASEEFDEVYAINVRAPFFPQSSFRRTATTSLDCHQPQQWYPDYISRHVQEPSSASLMGDAV